MFRHVAIIGPGLVGGFIGMGLRKLKLARRVTGVGRRPSSLDKALVVDFYARV